MKINRENYRHNVRFALLLLVLQSVVFLLRITFFNMMFSQAVYDSYYNGNQVARTASICLSVIAVLGFCIAYALEISRKTEDRRLFASERRDKDNGFSSLASLCLKKNLWHTAIFAALQLPILIFYSMFGVVYVDETLFEDFNALFIGFFEITKIGIVGLIISCAFFFALQMLFEIKVYRDWIKSGI